MSVVLDRLVVYLLTIMTNTALIEDFASLSALTHANNASISAQGQQRIATVEDSRWRQEVLTKNDEYESLLHTNAKRAADSDRSLLSNDLQAIEIGGAARLPDSVLAFLARKQGKCKSFVQARRMSSKGDANFSTPSHVGKIAGLKLHYPQIMIRKTKRGFSSPPYHTPNQSPYRGWSRRLKETVTTMPPMTTAAMKPSRVRVRRSIQVLTLPRLCPRGR